MQRPLISVVFTVALQMSVVTADLDDACVGGAESALNENSTHGIWGEVLSKYVESGTIGSVQAHLVDYDKLREDPSRLEAYLRQLCDVSESQLQTWEPGSALALLMNAYNALMFAMVVHFEPSPSINDLSKIVGESVWDHKFLNLGGTKVSANMIEHTMIRGKGGENQNLGWGYAPKVSTLTGGLAHAGIVCASLSCPDVPMEPFVGSTVVAQLTTATEAWLANPTKNRKTGDAVLVSQIFDWYAADFAGAAGSVHAYLDKYAPASWDGVTMANEIKYMKYDWYLNMVGGTASALIDGCRWLSPALALACPLTLALSWLY